MASSPRGVCRLPLLLLVVAAWAAPEEARAQAPTPSHQRVEEQLKGEQSVGGVRLPAGTRLFVDVPIRAGERIVRGAVLDRSLEIGGVSAAAGARLQFAYDWRGVVPLHVASLTLSSLTTYGRIGLPAGSVVLFTPAGEVESIGFADAVVIESVPVPKHAQAWLFPSGRVRLLWGLRQAVGYPRGGLTFSLGFSPLFDRKHWLAFHENGQVLSGWLAESTVFESGSHEADEQVYFDSSGRRRLRAVDEPRPRGGSAHLRETPFGAFRLLTGYPVVRYPGGGFLAADLAVPARIGSAQVPRGREVLFYEDGTPVPVPDPLGFLSPEGGGFPLVRAYSW